METLSILIIFGALAFFALLVYLAIHTDRSDAENKRKLTAALGFTPIEPDERLNAKISQLYMSGTRGKNFCLKHVSRKELPDGEMYLFDVIETSGEDNSISDQQALAIVSHRLNLPPFVLYPKVDSDTYMLGGFANKLIRWATTFIGQPVDFPEYPDFQKKYTVSSPDPEPVRRFFSPSLARTLANTSLYQMYAGGDAFTFSRLNTKFKKPDQEILAECVNQAMYIFQGFLDLP